MAEQLQNAGDVAWDYLQAINYAGISMDLLGMMVELSLYEDIMTHTVYGVLTILDTNNIITTFPFIGQEKLLLGFHTPTMGAGIKGGASIQKFCKIISVSDKYVEGNRQIYKLNFISIDAFLDVCFTENRAITGTSDVIINNILQNMWNWPANPIHSKYKTTPGVSYNGQPPFNVLEFGDSSTNPNPLPTNTIKFVSPMWQPMKCIAWATKQALNSLGYADYLYYESNQGIHFKSLSDHIYKGPLIDWFMFDQSPAVSADGAPDMASAYRKIQDMRVIAVNDQLARIMNRTYGQKIYAHNILYKSLVEITTREADTMNVVNLLSKFPIAQGNEVDWVIADDAYDDVANIYPYMFDNIPTDFQGKIDSTRLPSLNRLDFQKVDIDVWGRSNIKVGDKVTIFLGNYTSLIDAIDASDNVSQSGFYIVSAIHHRVAPSQHKMTMQCVRDSTYQNMVAATATTT